MQSIQVYKQKFILNFQKTINILRLLHLLKAFHLLYFITCFLLIILGIRSIFSISQSIVDSIVAAYIFYLLTDFFPRVFDSYKECKTTAIAYRKLQLLIHRLDMIFITPYKIKHNLKSLEEIDDNINIDVFFEKNFLLSFMEKLTLDKESNVLKVVKTHSVYLTYKELLPSLWREIKIYSNNLLDMPYVKRNHELCYHLNYLISESTLAIVLNNVFLLEIANDYSTILSISQKDETPFNRTIETIKALHKISFNLYKALQLHHNLNDIIAPMFYKSNKS